MLGQRGCHSQRGRTVLWSRVHRHCPDDPKKHSFWASLLTLYYEPFLISGVLKAFSRSIDKNEERWSGNSGAAIFQLSYFFVFNFIEV